MVPASRPIVHLGNSGETDGQRLRLAVTSDLVRKAQGVVGDEVPRAEPARSSQQIRGMIKLFAAKNHLSTISVKFFYILPGESQLTEIHHFSSLTPIFIID